MVLVRPDAWVSVDASGCSDVYGDVVQKPGSAQPTGDEHAGDALRGRRTQLRVPYLEIVDVDGGHLVQHGARGVQCRCGATGGGVHAGQQRGRQRTRLFAFDVIEVAVARRHGQPVRLPDDRHADDLRVDVEVGDHLPDQHELLIILLAE